jgi:hypothetical protein
MPVARNRKELWVYFYLTLELVCFDSPTNQPHETQQATKHNGKAMQLCLFSPEGR